MSGRLTPVAGGLVEHMNGRVGICVTIRRSAGHLPVADVRWRPWHRMPEQEEHGVPLGYLRRAWTETEL